MTWGIMQTEVKNNSVASNQRDILRPIEPQAISCVLDVSEDVRVRRQIKLEPFKQLNKFL